MSDRITAIDGARFELVIHSNGAVAVWDFARPGEPDQWRQLLGPALPPTIPWPPPDPPAPPIGPVPERVEGLGVSYYTALTDARVSLDEWANRTRDAGSRHTRVFLFDAWANGRLDSGPGIAVGFQPWILISDLRFDLLQISAAYLDRLDAFLEAFHRTGQHVCLSLVELYTWSARKDGLLWVPRRNLQPQRNNVQDVRWGDPDDDEWLVNRLPDEYLAQLLGAVLTVIGSRWAGVTLEIGNELPEKGLHARIRDLLRNLGWRGRIQVNRNEDTPSMYDNMGIDKLIGYRGNPENGGYDALAIHGRDSLSYLDEDFGPEQHKHRTFRAFYESGDITPGSLVLSTDGVGNNSAPPYYDVPELVAVSRDALARGFAVEHQAREIKLGSFLQGRIDLADLNVDVITQMRG